MTVSEEQLSYLESNMQELKKRGWAHGYIRFDALEPLIAAVRELQARAERAEAEREELRAMLERVNEALGALYGSEAGEARALLARIGRKDGAA